MPHSLEHELPELIRAHLRSVWALEVLILVRRERPGGWTPKELCDELRATIPIVTTALESFVRSGLVAPDPSGRFYFSPASKIMADFAAAVAAQYQARPVSLINLIVAPEDKIQQLADAFRFGRSTPK